MSLPKHYHLKREEKDHFVLHDARDNAEIKIAKKGIHPANQMKILRLQKFEGGGLTKDVGIDTEKSLRSPDYPLDDAPMTIPDQPPDMGQLTPQYMDQPAPSLQTMTAPNQLPGPPQPMPTQPQPQAQAPQVNPMAGMPTTQSLNQMGGQYEGAIMKGAQGQIEQNQQMAELYQPKLQAQEQAAQAFQATMEKQQRNADELAQSVASEKIDPSKFWHDKSTGSKVLAAISVVLGGIGQALTHQNSNAALTVVQNAIDKDIDAQKANLGKKQTLLSDNLRQQGNLIAAENATRAQYESLFQGKVAQMAAKTNNPMVLSNAQKEIMESKMRMMQYMQPVAQNQMIMQLRDSLNKGNVKDQDPASYVPYIVPEAERKAVYEEIKNAQNIAANGPKMLDAFDRAAREQTMLKTGGGMLRSSPALMELHQLMLPNFKSIDGTVRQAAMDESFNNVSPSAGDSDMFKTTATKRRALLNWIISESAAPTAKGSGLDLKKFSSTAPMTGDVSNEGKTATNAQGKRIIMKNGQWVPYGGR